VRERLRKQEKRKRELYYGIASRIEKESYIIDKTHAHMKTDTLQSILRGFNQLKAECYEQTIESLR